MIVQFLNGRQLVLADKVCLSDAILIILSRTEELELDAIFSSQIKLSQSEVETNLWYAFIRPMIDITFDEMSKELAGNVYKEERQRLLDAYIQTLADAREINFSATRGRYYEIYNKDLSKCLSSVYSSRWWNEWDFNHPEAYVPRIAVSEEEGKVVYNHWVKVNEEHFALSTIVNEEDLD
jgi:hypothetical protein